MEYRLTQLEQTLRQNYLTEDAMNNRFVTRKESREAASGRRERWPIALGVAVIAIQTIGLVVQLRGGR